MRRAEFEHVIAAAAAVAGEQEIVVVGSQAILGSFVDPPQTMLLSMEADIYPLRAPEKAEEIQGSLGDGSCFHGSLIRVEIPPRVAQASGAIALCLEPHDLVLAKCVAGRQRDWEFAADALAGELVQLDELLDRTDDLPSPPADPAYIRNMLEGHVARLRR
jgi:hypothetical protein